MAKINTLNEQQGERYFGVVQYHYKSELFDEHPVEQVYYTRFYTHLDKAADDTRKRVSDLVAANHHYDWETGETTVMDKVVIRAADVFSVYMRVDVNTGTGYMHYVKREGSIVSNVKYMPYYISDFQKG